MDTEVSFFFFFFRSSFIYDLLFIHRISVVYDIYTQRWFDFLRADSQVLSSFSQSPAFCTDCFISALFLRRVSSFPAMIRMFWTVQWPLAYFLAHLSVNAKVLGHRCPSGPCLWGEWELLYFILFFLFFKVRFVYSFSRCLCIKWTTVKISPTITRHCSEMSEVFFFSVLL